LEWFIECSEAAIRLWGAGHIELIHQFNSRGLVAAEGVPMLTYEGALLRVCSWILRAEMADLGQAYVPAFARYLHGKGKWPICLSSMDVLDFLIEQITNEQNAIRKLMDRG